MDEEDKINNIIRNLTKHVPFKKERVSKNLFTTVAKDNTKRNQKRRRKKALEKKKCAIIASEGRAAHYAPKIRRIKNIEKIWARNANIKSRG